MNKAKKKDLVKELLTIYGQSDWVFLINHKGLDAGSTLLLRSDLRAANASMLVVKNKINKIAIEQTRFANIADKLIQQVAIICANDPVSASKVIKKHSSTDTGGISVVNSSDGKVLYDAADVDRLASLPPISVLHSQLLGVLVAPASKLLRLLKEPSSALLRTLDAKKTKSLT